MGETAGDRAGAADLAHRGGRPREHRVVKGGKAIPRDRRLERLGEDAHRDERVAQVGRAQERLAPAAD